MGSRFRPAVTLPILVFLQIIPGVTGQYSIIPPDSPVLGVVGDGAVLPCQLQGRIIPEKLSIQWIFSGSSTESEVAIFYGKNHQNPFLEFKGYQSRTEFFPSEFHRGNLSLLLKNVRPSDKGEYTCSVFLENWYDQVMVELDVAAQGAEPSVFLDGHAGNGISLSCRSQGWFPAPSVVWLDSQGQTRPEEVTTRSTTGPSSGIFDVVSSMSLELGSDREVSCRVVNEVLNATRESRVRIADSFFPSTSPWMIASLIILSVDLGILGATVYKMKQRSRKEAGTEKDRLKAQLERLRAELDFWEARSHAVPVALDPEARPLDPWDLPSPFQGWVLVARDALGAGKCYWEVELGRERDWALGVLRDGPSLAGPHSRDSRHSRHCWALCASQGQLFSSGSGSRLLREQSRGLSALGVFLDSEEERLEFYDVEQRDLVAGMSLGSGDNPVGGFFPFISRMQTGTLWIRPVPIPVPLKKHRGV
ncbi:butyrophilin subfamily 3 member A2-like isoform X1 [Corvus moneduloides]|uniref:butyrophilin subfamily 3 member A2-like isoform X1 n=1 Tax=Corvus moneduloides TaxID=1196302 RepID=UPI00136311AB|nr:butyrophilin subfamily 3 member A2-like isoform X1 [Corvus moneduloides]XP_031950679.1 butyrophilin subfamily 3 member A2-like isoform X1 [Corvus moneduloides]